MTEEGEKRQEAAGQVATKFYPGDGTEYDLSLRVISYSEKEDWLMGVSYIEHTYSRPQHSLVPFYPPHYVASVSDKGVSQPYTAVPWMAEFKGCCRQVCVSVSVCVCVRVCARACWPALSDQPDVLAYLCQFKGKGSSFNFNIRATVDLDDHVASARIVSMPKVYVYPDSAAGNRVALCALSKAGAEGMVMKTNGTVNFPSDDHSPAVYEWSVESATNAEIVQDVTVLGKPSKNNRCAVLRLKDMYVKNQMDYVVVGVKLGNAKVTADIAIRALPEAEGMKNVLYAMSASFSLFGCPKVEFCEKDQAFNKALPAIGGERSVDIISRLGEPLEVRYVIATGKQASSLVATQNKTVEYSKTIAGIDHHALPDGAAWSPVSDRGEYVTAIDVEFSASEANTRPNVDLAISHEQRDYTKKAKLGPDWSRVADSNFNKDSGGATVTILLEHLTSENDPNPGDASTDQAGRAAVTDVVLASEQQVSGFLEDGFTKIDKNLLEQSNRGAIYIMYKRGSGSPVLDIRASGAPGYKPIAATSSAGVEVRLFVQYSRDLEIARTLTWTPCTGQDQEYVICIAVAAWNASFAYSTPQQCILLDVMPTSAPIFCDNPDGDCLDDRSDDGHSGNDGHSDMDHDSIDSNTDGHQSYPDGPWVLCPGRPSSEYCDCTGDCFESPYCSCAAAQVPSCCNGQQSESDGSGHSGSGGNSDGDGAPDAPVQATMGKMLEIPLRVQRTDAPLSSAEVVPTIRFSEENGKPADSHGVSDLLTGRTPRLAQVVQLDGVTQGLAPRVIAGDSSLRGEFEGKLQWIPSPYQGGWEGDICIEACVSTTRCPAALGGAAEACSKKCYRVKVARCKWALQGEDSLIEIAPRFQTNWLQLWYLNPFMGHPDHAAELTAAGVAAGQGQLTHGNEGEQLEINVGRVYTPLWDDTLALVAERFGMTPERLVQVNADLTGMEPGHLFSEWHGNTDDFICIIPDSCGLGSSSVA